MSDKVADPIEFILNSQLSSVLSSGFSQLYRVKPDFPVSFLAKWLKDYSHAQKEKKANMETIKIQSGLYDEKQKQKIEQKNSQNQQQMLHKKAYQQKQSQFKGQIEQQKYLEDLLLNWLPEYIEKRYQLSGCYVGHLTHLHKPLETNNFEPGSEFDTESPKVIEYIGTSNSSKSTMHMKILPNDAGVSYSVFNEPEPEGDQNEEKQKKVKPNYLYVPDVTKEDKIYYFKFPKLGSFACFPLKMKSFLIDVAFDQGLGEYKEYLKTKEDNENQYREKLAQVRQNYEDLKKRHEEMENTEEEPNQGNAEERKNLSLEVDAALQKLNQVQNQPPVTPLPNFATAQKMYLLGCDTLGQGETIAKDILSQIDSKVSQFVAKFQEKQKKMLLDDILAFLDEETKVQSGENQYRQFEKNVINQSQEIVKQKFTREKEVEYEITVSKCKKMESIFSETFIQKSMEVYFSYNIPKYQQIYQIALMLIGYPKKQINLPRKNALDFRKVRDQKFIDEFFNKLFNYELRRSNSSVVDDEYKINALLNRMEKIDLDQVSKYNTFIWALANHVKLICWARLQCKQAKIEAHEYSVKAKDERQAEIVKFNQEFEKELETKKSEAGEEEFNEEEWRANYLSENQRPASLDVQELEEFLDLQ